VAGLVPATHVFQRAKRNRTTEARRARRRLCARQPPRPPCLRGDLPGGCPAPGWARGCGNV